MENFHTRQLIEDLAEKMNEVEVLDALTRLVQASPNLRERSFAPEWLRAYETNQLISPTEPGLAPYTRKHVVQALTVFHLQALDVPDTQIRSIVQGVSLDNLLLLCDDPEEAARKAEVMSSWLQMLGGQPAMPAARSGTRFMHGGVDTPLEPPPAPPPTYQAARGAPSATGSNALGTTRAFPNRARQVSSAEDEQGTRRLSLQTTARDPQPGHSPGVAAYPTTLSAAHWARFTVAEGVEVHVDQSRWTLSDDAWSRAVAAFLDSLPKGDDDAT